MQVALRITSLTAVAERVARVEKVGADEIPRRRGRESCSASRERKADMTEGERKEDVRKIGRGRDLEAVGLSD